MDLRKIPLEVGFVGVGRTRQARCRVAVAAGLAATLLFRGFSFWLPMIPGLLLARREARGRANG